MSADAGATLRDARDAYFVASSLPEGGGYDEKWVKIKLGPFPFAYPNSAGRRRIAPAHDLHHVVTGYGTDLVGEGEIAAWEIGSGMRDRTGLQLALRVLGFVVPTRPRQMFRAFLRGRRSRNLLDRTVDEALLDRTVGDLRAELGVDREPPPPEPSDRLAFAKWAAAGVAIVWGPLIPIAALIWYLT